jgi:hypothetical protein
MSSLRIDSILAQTGLYWAAVLFVAVATPAPTPSFSFAVLHRPQLVDRLHKGDRLAAPRDAGSSISVELSASSNVVIRDTEGNILFAVDNAARATTVAKQSGRSIPPLKLNPPAEIDLPDGCEGAFSPYAEPSKARIIGRCMSNILSEAEIAS